MTFSFSLLALLLFLALAQTITISAILLVRNARRNFDDLILSILFFSTLYIYLSDLLIPTGLYRIVPFLIYTDFPVLFAVPPLLYFYLLRQSRTELRVQRWSAVSIGKHSLHFIPFLIALILSIPRFIESASQKIGRIDNQQIPAPMLGPVDSTIISYVQFFIYLIIGWKLIASMKDADDPRIQQQYKVLKGMLLLYFITFAALVLAYSRIYWGPSGSLPKKVITNSSLMMDFPILLICIYSYYLLLQRLTGERKNGDCEKYHKSALAECELQTLYNRLLRIVQDERLWENPHVDLTSLAKRLECSYHHLSQSINVCTGTNFHCFINRFRSDEACRLLMTSDQTVIEIAYASGFNSKATFNSVFKKNVGCTPTEFRKNSEKKEYSFIG